MLWASATRRGSRRSCARSTRGRRRSSSWFSRRGPKLDVFEAAALRRLDPLERLLKRSPKRATAFSKDGFTALHLAAYFGRPEAARLLLERGADVHARSGNSRLPTVKSPLHSAAAGRRRRWPVFSSSTEPARTRRRRGLDASPFGGRERERRPRCGYCSSAGPTRRSRATTEPRQSSSRSRTATTKSFPSARRLGRVRGDRAVVVVRNPEQAGTERHAERALSDGIGSPTTSLVSGLMRATVPMKSEPRITIPHPTPPTPPATEFRPLSRVRADRSPWFMDARSTGRCRRLPSPAACSLPRGTRAGCQRGWTGRPRSSSG